MDNERREDAPVILDFPKRAVEPDNTFSVVVPPSTEPRLLTVQFYAPRTPKPAASQGQTALTCSTEAVVTLGLRSTSSLPAAAAGV